MTDLDNFDLKTLANLNYDELIHLCENIRAYIIEANSKTGGHIGANLGVIELTVAVHKVFNSPIDTFVFDTGHIGYTHKILTGRGHLFPTLNSFGGMNRFITPDESNHDIIEMSHAGTSLSIGLGLAMSKKKIGNCSHTISVIGDGSLAEGIALEALNHIPKEKVNFLIVINDNSYAISPAYGAIHDHLLSLGKESSTNLFQNLGFEYSGPIDGHNLPLLIEEFNKYKNAGGLKVIHIKSEKGKGYKPAICSPVKMHFSNPFNLETGYPLDPVSRKSIASFATDAILEKMVGDEKILTFTAGTKYATDLDRIAERFPNRCIDPGMSEQHVISLAVGTALSGMYPIVNYQSTFMQRAYDQMMHDVAFTNKPIMFLLARSGFAGYDNPTHHGIYDFSYLKALPNVRLIYPANCKRLKQVVKNEIDKKSGPVIICYPYGFEDEYSYKFQPSTTKDKLLIVTTGNMAGYLQNFKTRQKINDISIFPIENLVPFDEDTLLRYANNFKVILSVEEGVKRGGINESISSILFAKNKLTEYKYLALSNSFFPGGSSEELREYSGIDARTVFDFAKDMLNG